MDLNFMEIVGLLLLGLFIFGPERLPQVIGDGMRMLRNVRQMAQNATTELREELGTDLDLEDLNPKTFVRKHLFSEDEQERLTRPLRDAYADVEDLARDGRASDEPRPSRRTLREGERPPFDADAT
ncbi:MAG TPA: sec-independent translocase [Mycobacteriales bacterium]|nr:sec-independent translocase [Mycobacteriales bacterium]